MMPGGAFVSTRRKSSSFNSVPKIGTKAIASTFNQRDRHNVFPSFF